MTEAVRFETVRFERTGDAARVVLDRPATLNAWVPQLGDDLQAALELCADDAVRAVLVTGAGRAFSSGADLTPPEGEPLGPHEMLVRHYHPVLTGIRALPKPVIAGVGGPAAGIGCSLALCCDLVLAAESAFFLLAFVNIALVPDGGASVWVPARAGAGRALQMALLGERVPAPQALEWGLADRVVGDGDFEAACEELLARMAAGPTATYAAIKRLIDARVYAGAEAQLEREAVVQEDMVVAADHVEGVAAFRERRPARFTGR